MEFKQKEKRKINENLGEINQKNRYIRQYGRIYCFARQQYANNLG